MKLYYVYILTNWNNKVMYIGMTNNIQRRMHEHRSKLFPGFTSNYNLNKLVYIETTTNVLDALAREKELKSWRREKKNRLVSGSNSEWLDLDPSHAFGMTGK
jgi:putative endonuclease